jgi:microcystin-dependent protein
MTFRQTSAPLNWTKSTAFDDYGMRIVSGSVSSGGSTAFSTVFGQTVVGSTTLSICQIPSHSHTVCSNAVTCYGGGWQGGACGGPNNSAASISIGSTGGGQSHNHTVNLTLKYVDLIIATKN